MAACKRERGNAVITPDKETSGGAARYVMASRYRVAVSEKTTVRSKRSAASISTVGQGEIFGLIGPDGAGKTSIFQILGGVMQRDEPAKLIILGRSARDARS